MKNVGEVEARQIPADPEARKLPAPHHHIQKADRYPQCPSQFLPCEKLSPPIPSSSRRSEIETTAGGTDEAAYDYEPGEAEILADLLPRNVAVQILRALLENAASEQGARMSAMDNATRNAGEMIKKQTQLYNRSRQAMITKELIEIISGAEAL